VNATAGTVVRARATGLRPSLSSPHVALGAAAVVVLAAEAGYDWRTSDAWLVLEAAAGLAALVYAWRVQERLRLWPLLALAASFALALVLLHLGLDVRADKDSSVVYRWQGNGLRRGDYPRSEYPLGAVLLFAFEAWLGGGATRAVNAFLMIPFQLATVAAVWLVKTRHAAWLAALVALWPMNAYYWEFKFDLAPAALLAVGLVLAWRERFVLSGVVLGLGALVKWTPGLAAVALVVWLVASRRVRDGVAHGAAFALTVALVYLPFLVWSPSEVLAAYERQGGRRITAESVWYLILHPFGLADLRTHISFSAGAPGWANVAAGVAQALFVAGVLVIAARVRGNLRAGVAVAALLPVVFLLTNRIFSPQFVVVTVAAWAIAAALVVRGRREQLLVGLAVMAATVGNAFVFPYALPHYAFTWQLASLTLFAAGLGVTGWLLLRALSTPRGA
jgi:hypothetical protein